MTRSMNGMGPAVARILVGALLIVAIVMGPALYGKATSGPRLAPALSGVDHMVSVKVELPFKPRAFNQSLLSERGVFGGIQDTTVILLNVTPENLSWLASQYWIEQIVPLQG